MSLLNQCKHRHIVLYFFYSLIFLRCVNITNRNRNIIIRSTVCGVYWRRSLLQQLPIFFIINCVHTRSIVSHYYHQSNDTIIFVNLPGFAETDSADHLHNGYQ